MKVTLVGINSKYIHSNLAIRYLKAYTEDLNYECNIREFSINDREERVVYELINEKSNILIFSCYIWNIEFVKKVSNLIKIIDDSIEILYGGPEVSFNGMEFLKNNVGEYLIEGEGEKTYREFILYKLNEENCIKSKVNSNNTEENVKSGLKDIKGLYYKEASKIYYGGIRENMNIDEVVFPYTKEDELDNKIVYYEASRGCPFGCKYCLSSVDRKVRFRNTEKVKKELQYFMDKKVKLVKFVDRTFNCSESFAIEIWKFLIEQDTQTKFHFEISADILTKKEIEILSKAPKERIQFEVGVQTTNDKILKNINRHVNFSDIQEKVEEIKSLKNINQHLDLIAGLPGEDITSFKKSFNDIYSIHPEEIQLGFLKLLKGSPMLNEAKVWGMKYSPYPPYEILKTNHVSYYELMELKKVESMVDKYYNSGKFNTIIKYFIPKFENPFEFYYSLGKFFNEKGYFNRNISAMEYYKVFLDFNSVKLNEDNFALREIIKYDYLMFNKKKGVPGFLKKESNKNEINKVKSKLLENGFELKNNNYHVEKFNIDVLHFIKTREILENKTYMLYDINNYINIQDVTPFVK